MSESDKIKTPSGLTMGKRVMKHGKPCMEYRREGRADVMTPETVVERITGVKVKAIIYETTEESA